MDYGKKEPPHCILCNTRGIYSCYGQGLYKKYTCIHNVNRCFAITELNATKQRRKTILLIEQGSNKKLNDAVGITSNRMSFFVFEYSSISKVYRN